MNLEFDEKAYQDYLVKREYPSNTRIRPEGMDFMDVLFEGQKIMESTEEGKKALEYIGHLGE
jgi:hypothetical protein